MTDISKDAVDRLVKDVANRQKMRTVGVHIVQHVSETLRAMSARIDQLEAALSDIARPKVGPDHDWSDGEVNKWRASWYQKYELIARNALIDKEPTT